MVLDIKFRIPKAQLGGRYHINNKTRSSLQLLKQIRVAMVKSFHELNTIFTKKKHLSVLFLFLLASVQFQTWYQIRL